jgi:RNA 3'-terminal phosphate cyclase (ATP)
MIIIDGKIGYGQILRTAIALASLMLKPIRIFNIRKGRPKPGLMPQHLMGVKIAGEFCEAEIKGLDWVQRKLSIFLKALTFMIEK